MRFIGQSTRSPKRLPTENPISGLHAATGRQESDVCPQKGEGSDKIVGSVEGRTRKKLTKKLPQSLLSSQAADEASLRTPSRKVLSPTKHQRAKSSSNVSSVLPSSKTPPVSSPATRYPQRDSKHTSSKGQSNSASTRSTSLVSDAFLTLRSRRTTDSSPASTVSENIIAPEKFKHGAAPRIAVDPAVAPGRSGVQTSAATQPISRESPSKVLATSAIPRVDHSLVTHEPTDQYPTSNKYVRPDGDWLFVRDRLVDIFGPPPALKISTLRENPKKYNLRKRRLLSGVGISERDLTVEVETERGQELMALLDEVDERYLQEVAGEVSANEPWSLDTGQKQENECDLVHYGSVIDILHKPGLVPAEDHHFSTVLPPHSAMGDRTRKYRKFVDGQWVDDVEQQGMKRREAEREKRNERCAGNQCFGDRPPHDEPSDDHPSSDPPSNSSPPPAQLASQSPNPSIEASKNSRNKKRWKFWTKKSSV